MDVLSTTALHQSYLEKTTNKCITNDAEEVLDPLIISNFVILILLCIPWITAD